MRRGGGKPRARRWAGGRSWNFEYARGRRRHKRRIHSPMKKLLLATLLIASLTALVPTAGACDKKKKTVRYYQNDYRQSYRESYQPDYGYYQAPPVYYRPAPVVQYRSRDYEDCRPASRTYHRPALSVFGF